MEYSHFFSKNYTFKSVQVYDSEVVGLVQLDAARFAAVYTDGVFGVIDINGSVIKTKNLGIGQKVDCFSLMNTGFMASVGPIVYSFDSSGIQVARNEFDRPVSALSCEGDKVAIAFWENGGTVEIYNKDFDVLCRSQECYEKIISICSYSCRNDQFLVGCSDRIIFRFKKLDGHLEPLNRSDNVDDSVFNQIWCDGNHFVVDNLSSVTRPDARFEKKIKNAIFFRVPEFGYDVFHAQDGLVVFGGKGGVSYKPLKKEKPFCINLDIDSKITTIRRFGQNMVLFGTSCGEIGLVDYRSNSQRFIVEE